jgi:DNA-binding transcriptional LysR family regulator
VSKQIAQLENWFGKSLFGRNRKTLRPTDEGLTLARATTEALDIVALAVEDIRFQESASTLQVLAPSTFAMRWLIPRVWGFADANSRIDIQLRQTHSRENWLDLPFEVAIRMGSDAPPHLTSVPFLTEELVLAISPISRFASLLNSPGDLLHSGVLKSSTRPDETENWLDHAGLDKRSVKTTVFPHFYLALEAALAGMGPLVCPRVTLGDLLSKGDLIEPWPELRMPGPTYVALYAKGSRRAAAVETFINWLSRQTAQKPPTLQRNRQEQAA